MLYIIFKAFSPRALVFSNGLRGCLVIYFLVAAKIRGRPASQVLLRGRRMQPCRKNRTKYGKKSEHRGQGSGAEEGIPGARKHPLKHISDGRLISGGVWAPSTNRKHIIAAGRQTYVWHCLRNCYTRCLLSVTQSLLLLLLLLPGLRIGIVACFACSPACCYCTVFY